MCNYPGTICLHPCACPVKLGPKGCPAWLTNVCHLRFAGNTVLAAGGRRRLSSGAIEPGDDSPQTLLAHERNG